MNSSSIKTEPRDFPKTEPHDFLVPKLEPHVFPKKEAHSLFPKAEEFEGSSSTLMSMGSSFPTSKQNISFKSERSDFSWTKTKQSMRMRDFISLLSSYPVKITDDNKFKDWQCDESPLIYAEGLVPTEIIRAVQQGEGSIFKDELIPEAIRNLSADLAVDHLIQVVMLSKHDHNVKYIRLLTRSAVEKRAVEHKIEAALEDKQDVLEFHRIDASTYQNSFENKVIQQDMGCNKHLVLLVYSDAENKFDPPEVASTRNLSCSGTVVFITTERDENDLSMGFDLEIRTKDHVLPWEVFCRFVKTTNLRSSSSKQKTAVRIVEECRGHLLSIVLVAKWLKKLRNVEQWDLALQKIHCGNPCYDIPKFQGLSIVMVNTFMNLVWDWDGINETHRFCLQRCLFIPKIKDWMVDSELMIDWVSSELVDAREAEHTLRDLVGHSVLLQFEGLGCRYIRLPEETYEILESLYNLNPLFIKKPGQGLTEPPNIEQWQSVVQIELADNKLPELPLSPTLPQLRVLLLQGNADLTKIPPLFFVHMPLLGILNLSHTSVRELPRSFFNLVQLRELYLRGCECFMKLQSEIGKLQKLEKLDLEKTQIINMPKELQELTNMQSLSLYFYEYRGKKTRPYSSSAIIPSGVIPKLKRLKHLNIDVNPDDERWNENVQVILPEILGLECLKTLSLYIPQLQLLKLIPARSILRLDFRFHVGRHMQRIISGIPSTIDEKFKQIDRRLKFSKGVDVPPEIKMLARHSKALFLDRHMTIKNLSEFGTMNLEELRVCILAECREMQTIVDGGHSKSNNDVLSRLLFLSVSHMKNLRSIWEGPTLPRSIFGMLQSLSLQNCPMLVTLFSWDFLGNLSLLKELIIKDCSKLSTLIHRQSSTFKVCHYLPKLTKLFLVHLPELINISNGVHIGPSLKEIGIYGCPKLLSLSRKELSSQNLTIIKGETNWWKALKWSKGEWGEAGRPSKFDCIFSTINGEGDVMTQFGTYEDDIQNIEAVTAFRAYRDLLSSLARSNVQEYSAEVLNTPTFPNYSSILSLSNEATAVVLSGDSMNEQQSSCKARNEHEADNEDGGREDKLDHDKTKKQLKGKKNIQKNLKEPIFAFMTKSEVDHIEDGYRWRKYGTMWEK